MHGFTELKGHALNFPHRLGARMKSKAGCQSFFALPRSWLFHDVDDKIARHGQLIRDMAIILDETKLDSDIKFQILRGTYYFVWSHYQGPVAYWLTGELTALLQEDTEHASLANVNSTDYQNHLNALAEFLSDVAIRPDQDAYRLLYTSTLIPADIQLRLLALKNAQPEDGTLDTLSWSGLQRQLFG